MAALAGVPSDVIKRAKTILNSIISDETEKLYKPKKKETEPQPAQISLGDIASNEIIEELKRMDVTSMSAIDTMNELYRLSLKAKEI